jgi:hypothetical protein
MNQSKIELVSICIPVLNEESNIFPLYEKINAVMENLKDKYLFEVIFTDNVLTRLILFHFRRGAL